MKIKLFTKPSCAQCTGVKIGLKARGLIENEHYEVIDMSVDAAALETVKGLGFLQAPVVVADNFEPFSGNHPDKVRAVAEAYLAAQESVAA